MYSECSAPQRSGMGFVVKFPAEFLRLDDRVDELESLDMMTGKFRLHYSPQTTHRLPISSAEPPQPGPTVGSDFAPDRAQVCLPGDLGNNSLQLRLAGLECPTLVHQIGDGVAPRFPDRISD